MAKNNNAKSFAEEGLEEVLQEAEAVEASLPDVAAPIQSIEEQDAGLEMASGVEPIVGYYQLKTPTKPGKKPVKIFQAGEVLKGSFIRTLERQAKTKDGRRSFTSYTYLVRLDTDGKVWGLGCAGLKRGFDKIENGRVHIRYDGLSKPNKEGQVYENFTILGKLKK